MLIQPVEWHMKEVEEEVPVDENLHLLQEKPKDSIVRKISQSNGDAQNQANSKENWEGKKTLSNKELNGAKINKSDANGLNGK